MTVRCPLCGYALDESREPACSACPMNRRCRVVCCPRCSYQTVEGSSIVDLWRKIKAVIKKVPRSTGGQ